MAKYRVLTINPGSTSTKVAVFDDETEVFSKNIVHAAEDLAAFAQLTQQKPYRAALILEALQENGIDLSSLSAVVGRGGGLLAVEGGVYIIDDLLLSHAEKGANGVVHPAQLGSLLANDIAKEYGIPAYVVNPPDTDELEAVARLTGIKGVYRNVHLHALNLKETAIRHAAAMHKKVEECNFIVCHIGGGVSVSAHRYGKMIDGNDIVGGEGPMAPTRCGNVPASEIIDLCFSGISQKEAKALCTKTGGFVSHLNTSDAREVVRLAEEGNQYAALVWDAFKYQIIKEIGAMAAVLQGKADGILLSGGIVHSQELVESIRQSCSWIAPGSAYPGEFEMEAMAAGAIRVLNGSEAVKTYSGKPVWNPKELGL